MSTQELVLTPPTPNEMDLLSIALQNNAAIDVIERMAALQREAMTRRALIDFNEALTRIQDQIKRIAPDMVNNDKKNKWASYAAIDRVIRPVYSKEGLSLSFTHGDCPKADHVRVICRVSLRSHVEFYQMDIPVDTKGPKGGDVMTLTHATAAADSYAKRYLVKDIFNIAIGEEDRDGNLDGDTVERIEFLRNCTTLAELTHLFKRYYSEAADKQSKMALIDAYENQKKELR